MQLRPSPLWRRAPTRLLHERAWGALVLAALTLLVATAAASPLFTAASGDAAMRTALSAVPATAVASDAPVVRVNGGLAPSEPKQAALLRALGAVPGLGPATVIGGSVGAELAPAATKFVPYVQAGDGRVRARLYGQQDLAATLVPAPGSPTVGTAGAGVWLPEPVARRLGVRPGGSVTVGVVTDSGTTAVQVRLAGVYVVGSDGRRPADPAGSRSWLRRGGLLPRDSLLPSTFSYLVVTDVPTAQRLADAVGDRMFWTAEAVLAPPVPTLVEAERTAAAVIGLQRELLDPTVVDITQGPLRPTVVSGLPEIVAEAQSAAGATASRTDTLGWAGIALGLTAVLAVGVLGAGRRRRETTHATSNGVHPVSLGLQAGLEGLPAALVAAAGGSFLALAVVARWGPPAPTTSRAVGSAVRQGVVAALAGLLLLALVSAAAGVLAARRPSARTAPLRRVVPWEGALAVVAGTAVLGLVTRPAGARAPGPLDLLVPLLVVAAAGALGGRVVLSLLARATTRAAAGPARAGRSASSRWPRLPALWLAGRRVAVPAPERIFVVTALAAGLGMLLYAVSAASTVRLTSDDRVAVLSGARATAQIEGSWQLVDHPPLAPRPLDPGFSTPIPTTELPPVWTPSVPTGAALVWRRTAIVPSLSGQLDLLIVDPTTFDAAASWGRGAELARARQLLHDLADRGREAVDRIRAGHSVALPTVLVGDPSTVGRTATSTTPGLTAGGNASISGGQWLMAVRLLAVVPAFPGHDSSTAMLVVPADAFFANLGAQDPRYMPRPGQDPADPAFSSWLWSSHGTAGVDEVLAAHDVDPIDMRTDAQVRAEPSFVAAERSLGYLLALGGCVALLAVVALGLFADRTAGRSRPADVMLARVGMGRRGTRRARFLELVLLTATAVLAAVLGVVLVGRLGALGMDPGATSAPAFRLRVGTGGYLAVLVAALLALTTALLVAASRTTARTEGTVLRDAG